MLREDSEGQRLSNEVNIVTDDSAAVLHSWKRIAKYLNRSVRTARRWEESENLPVHRHMHQQNPTVFAYVHEIDFWLKKRESTQFNTLDFDYNHNLIRNKQNPPLAQIKKTHPVNKLFSSIGYWFF
ncbi:MAG: hypothetical protein COW84_09840 [Gammaproteobacteria bacterium CG22_combo_CG10-13_8_21_14_all_40_8]|nr:MAG: hypothetical protein COW84_09840 [Gammaproteobacteria bacterium CG22_combo_CG10-13_8_21_14_all_40_8]